MTLLAELHKLNERYDETAAWDADFNKLEDLINAAIKIVTSENWKKHMRDTDQNFDVNVKRISDALVGELEQANGTLSVLMNEMMKAA